VRDHKIAFRMAHAISARLIAARERNPQAPLSRLLADASAEMLGAPLTYSEPALAEILSARYFVNVRQTLGGPAPEQTARASSAAHAQLDRDQGWWTITSGALTDAQQRLAARAAEL
jgi:argininosuccinate lyase